MLLFEEKYKKYKRNRNRKRKGKIEKKNNTIHRLRPNRITKVAHFSPEIKSTNAIKIQVFRNSNVLVLSIELKSISTIVFFAHHGQGTEDLNVTELKTMLGKFFKDPSDFFLLYRMQCVHLD